MWPAPSAHYALLPSLGDANNKAQQKEQKSIEKKDDNELRYTLVMHEKVFEACQSYLEALKKGTKQPGSLLKAKCPDGFKEYASDKKEGIAQFIEKLFNTKTFGYSSVDNYLPTMDKKYWSDDEYLFLANTIFVAKVTTNDNGARRDAQAHEKPFPMLAFFIPGLLLQQDLNGLYSPDNATEIVTSMADQGSGVKRSIDQQKYDQANDLKFLPALFYAQHYFSQHGADWLKGCEGYLISIAGISCGLFAGEDLQQQATTALISYLETTVTKQSKQLQQLNVYIDTFQHSQPSTKRIGDEGAEGVRMIPFIVNPFLDNKKGKTALNPPSHYNDGEYQFNNHVFMRFDGADMFGYPGSCAPYVDAKPRFSNEYAIACATSLYQEITGIKGEYQKGSQRFLPKGSKTWEEAMKLDKEEFVLKIKAENICIASEDGKVLTLEEFLASKAANAKQPQKPSPLVAAGLNSASSKIVKKDGQYERGSQSSLEP